MRVSAPSQSVACEARHAPTGPRAGRVPLVEVWKFRGLEAWLFQRLHPSRACRAFCSPFSVAVEGLARCACTLRSPGRFSAPWFFVSLAVEGLALWACTVIAAQRSVSSPPRAAANFQASLERPAGGSRPLIGSNRRNRRFPYSGSQRALARRPSLCLSVFSVVSVFFAICGSPASCFVCLRGSSCPLCFPEKHSSFSQRLHLSRACRAFCSPFSVAVEGLARCACTLCSPGRRSRPFWGPF